MTLQQTALTSVATYRLTKLVIDDYITSDLRDKAFDEIDRLPPKIAEKLTYFLTCPWCVSIWAAAFLVLLRKITPNLTSALEVLLTSSAITGLIYEKV